MYGYCNYTNGLGLSSNNVFHNNIMHNDNSILYMAERLRIAMEAENKKDRREKDEEKE